jgi:long-chain acyl-CoA synthetase
MERIWLKNYPTSVGPDIQLTEISSISDRLEQAFLKFARLPAATCLDTTMTYGEVATAVQRLASFLQNNLGLKKGDIIAIMLPNTLQFVIAELAALKIGAICVNTNPLYTPREMKHQFKDSGAKAIIILDLFADKLAEIIKDTAIEHVIITATGDQLPAWKAALLSTYMRVKRMVPKHNLKAIRFKDALSKGNPKTLKAPKLNLDDIAILQYTGGTTGASRGAMLTQRNILANMHQIQAVTRDLLEPGCEVVLTALPLYHIFALTVNFLTFLADGHHMILVPRPVPISNTVKMFKKYRITVMTGVNTLFNSLNNSKEFQSLAPKTLKVVVAGGMALQDSVNRAFQTITGTRITEGFGLTEASPVTHVNPMSPNNPVGSIGIPLPSTYAKIVSEDGRDLLPGEVGELVIKGPQVMKGYWKRDDETAKVLRDGWLWTGDLGRMNEDGYFFIVDRKKDMVLVSGFNVYPNEVEDVLSSHTKVLEAAVIGVPDKTSGEAVKAFVVPKDKSLTVEELRAYCKENLTGYKVPRHFEFRDHLPKSNVGKILRRELREGQR